MSARRVEWLAVLVLTLITVGLVLLGQGARPGDLDVTVQARETAAPHDKQGQWVMVTVKWHWRRQPHEWLGQSADAISFDLDHARWFVRFDRPFGATSEQTALLNRYGLPASLYTNVQAGRDGQIEVPVYLQGEGGQDIGYRAAVLPLHVQFLHDRGESWILRQASWVKVAGGDLPLQ